MARKPKKAPDMGSNIRALAKDLTPGQIAEMLAISQTMAAVGHCLPVAKGHYTSPNIGPLVRRRLLTWDRASEPWSPGFRGCNLTKLGWQVLLARLEDEVRHILPPIPIPEGD